MTRRALLDANVLLHLHDSSSGAESLPEDIRGRLVKLLRDDEAELFITPLIRYEVLRGVGWGQDERYRSVKSSLDRLTELDVSRDASELAAQLFRLYVAEHKDDPGINVEKRRFDTFHFAVAKLSGLELISRDGDFQSLERLHARLSDVEGNA